MRGSKKLRELSTYMFLRNPNKINKGFSLKNKYKSLLNVPS